MPARRILAILLLVLAAWASAPQAAGRKMPVTPDLQSEIAELEQYLATHPDDPAALCHLGLAWARAGDSDAALDLFERVARGRSGLDPSGMPPKLLNAVVDTPRFRALAAMIHHTHPPRVRSRVAYTLGERDLVPEGIAWDPVGQAFYLSSIAKRKIVRLDRDGSVHTFKPAGVDGLGSVLGLKVDAKRRILWAVNNAPAGEKGGGRAAVYQYDLRTGALRFRHALPDGGGELLNDVAIAGDGHAYATDSNKGGVYRISPSREGLQLVVPAGAIREPNGLAVAPDDRWLFVAHGLGVDRIDLRTGERIALQVPAGRSIASLDGMYFHRGALVGIQNGLHSGRVLRMPLDDTFATVRAVEVLETYNPLFETPTTGTFVDDTFYFIGNSQLRRLGPGNRTPPAETMQEVRIHALEVSRRATSASSACCGTTAVPASRVTPMPAARTCAREQGLKLPTV